ncbi:MAG: hypothetical protein SCH66_12775 [Methanolobus sp.]|nr:hypothetical protein [Methanolobus sp.]
MEIEDVILSALFIGLLASLIICQSTAQVSYISDLSKTLAIGGICAYFFNNFSLF